jgi:hypothetical protein
MNLAGILFQALPVVILVLSGCRNLGSPLFRLLVAAVYLLLPNATEVYVTVTHAQWHLAVVACLLLFSHLPSTATGNLLDAVVFILCGLTVPSA